MDRRFFFVLAAFYATLLFLPFPTLFAAIENKLGNPGFEQDLGGSNNWDNTANRGISNPTLADAPEGSKVLRLDETGVGAGESSYTFQTVSGARPGDMATLSALVREVTIDDGDDDGQIRIEFQTSAGAPISDVVTSAASATFTRITASGTAPAGTAQVTFTLRIQNSETGGTSRVEFDDTKGTISNHPVFLEASPASSRAHPGDIVMVTMRAFNQSATDFSNVEVFADASPGLHIRAENASLDGNSVGHREGSIIFSLGTLTAGQESIFGFPVILTSGIIPGKSYEIRLRARNAAQGSLSQEVRVLIQAELDPVFDEGTIIGKVFNDTNQNGVQDKGEKGVPGVWLATEEGIVVTTDKDGKYHIPAVKPGRHLVKIDGHTLPEGTKMITETSYLVKTTPGILGKANFAVLIPPSAMPEEFQEDLTVFITHGLDTSAPVLDVKMEPDLLKVGIGVLERYPVFKLKTNYPEFVKRWYLEIRDETGEEVWTGFGVSTPPAEVPWSGETEIGLLIKPGIYSYQFKVEDQQDHKDWTPLHFFRVISKADESALQARPLEIPPVGNFNIFKDGKQTIPLVAKPTLRVQGKTKPGYQVTVNAYPVNVESETGLFQTEFYVTPGEKEITVTATSPEGESTAYTQKVKVKDSTFFMVALGEEQLGVNFQDGNVETAGNDDEFKKGFYENGRLSYYLRGKLKGKFLVKAHSDTDDKRSALFTNLDPDDYYPIYGDASTLNYEARDTRGRSFLIVEWDRSFLKWGSFKTSFTDTELASYSRTLSGFQFHFETLASTFYGDPKRGVKVYASDARHKAAHNEFAATGGSLYYLRNRHIIEGSEKVRIEVRDKIQDIAIHSRDLAPGRDYEIDYEEGRVMLSRPLFSVAGSDTLGSRDILDGSPVYLIVDYEFDAGLRAFTDTNRGLRGFTHMGNHVRLGATAVEEKRQGGDYDLRALDLTLKFGRNTQVRAEYAESKLQQMNQSVSFNGGLSFADLQRLGGRDSRPRENAYLIKAESQPVKNFELSGYLQGVDPGFSVDRIRTQEGTRKYGVASRYKFTQDFYIRYRFDKAELQNELLPLNVNRVSAPYEDFRANTAQAVYDDGRWLAELEYGRQVAQLPVSSQLAASLLSEIPSEHAVSAKVGHYFNEKLLPYAKVQTAFHGGANHQFGGGVRYQIRDNLFAYLEQMFGTIGDSTLFGFEKYHKGVRNYASLRSLDRGIGGTTLATMLGSSFALSEKSRVFSERMHSSYPGTASYADILGYEAAPGERWNYEVKFERRHLENSKTRLIDRQADLSLARANSFNSVAASVSYNDRKKITAKTGLEFRFDTDTPRLRQWLTRNSVEYKINQDLSALGKLDFGTSRFLNPADTPAHFMEFSTGLAYRPVEHDRLNLLTRYSYLVDIGNDLQFATPLFNGVEIDEKAHIFAIDLAYDLYKYLGMAEKLAYKNSILNTSLTNEIILHHFLWVHRFNVHVTRKWDVALEYRALWQFDAAKTLRHGPLVEVDRELYDYVRLGLGYNFTDFDDDLRRSNNYETHGPFVRLSGKF